MHRISLFAEDYGHEAFLTALIEHRMASEFQTEVSIRPVSVRGGHGMVETELEEYVGELLRFREQLPHLIVVATDSNCQGVAERRKRMQYITEQIKDVVVYAIPDPHVERWLLCDSAAFKTVLGAPCQAPDQKCSKNRYKQLLAEAVRDAGLTPLLGGLEHTEEIVKGMDFRPNRLQDAALRELVQDLRAVFRRWRDGEA